MNAGRRTLGLIGGAVAMLLALFGALVWLHLGSVAHGNALYRDGEIVQAGDRYAARRAAGDTDPALLYNAGTAQLTLRPDSATDLLLGAEQSGDSVVATRASYNLGYHYLTSIPSSMRPDSAIRMVTDAVRANKLALRRDPGFEDARWNLAVAQAMLDSLTQQYISRENEEDPGEDETRVDMEALARGEGDGRSGIEPQDAQRNESTGQRFAAAQGAREAWASRDPGPIDRATARGMLDNVRQTPEQLLRGLIWAHRPDVEWWNSEPYPGGNQ